MEISSKRPFISFTHRQKFREKNCAQPQDSDNSGKSPSAQEYDNSRNRRIDRSPSAQEYDSSRNRKIDRSPSAQEYDNSRKIDKNNTVRIVHRDGSVEIFHQPLSARVLMEAYPDYVVTRPDVFQRPRDAVLNPDAVLMPGNIFYLVSRKGIHRPLCKKRNNNNNSSSSNTELSTSKDLPASKKPRIVASAMTYVTQFFSNAKELYGTQRVHGHCQDHKGEDSGCEYGDEQKGGRASQFVPPLDDSEFYREFLWRPTLPVIQELSP
ncbi:hypothetical protein SUGI_0283680 [Cryptomeria japonica]|nr:hypothetical protein SUGI_0283680 [Cryptomeria japonica]